MKDPVFQSSVCLLANMNTQRWDTFLFQVKGVSEEITHPPPLPPHSPIQSNLTECPEESIGFWPFYPNDMFQETIWFFHWIVEEICCVKRLLIRINTQVSPVWSELYYWYYYYWFTYMSLIYNFLWVSKIMTYFCVHNTLYDWYYYKNRRVQVLYLLAKRQTMYVCQLSIIKSTFY